MTADPCQPDQQQLHLDDSPGAILARRRRELGLDKREVAAQLRLLSHQIDHLEQDDFDQFNNALFCKAHISAYARLLDLDAEQLVAMYRRRAPGADKPSTVNGATLPVQRPGRGHSLRYWGLGMAMVLGVMLWINRPVDIEKPEVNAAVDPNDQSSLQQLEGDAVADDTAPPTLLVSDYDAGDADTPVVIDLPARETAPAVGSGNTSPASTGDASDRLEFAFAEDCWVEVTDGNGSVIYAALRRADETLSLSGTGPFKVLLGYAHGVRLNYNGDPIEINVKNRNNSARLVVGNLPVR